MSSASSYSAVVDHLRRTFRSGKTKALEYRKSQLKQLIRLVNENADDICEVINKDIRRCKPEAYCYELGFILNEANTALSQLDTWAQPQKVKRHLLQALDSAFIASDPLGVVLIISPWNYPAQITLIPMLGALAAGNCVVLKPSEFAPFTASLLAELIPKYLDSDVVRVVTGGIPETTALLKERFDHILFTGHPSVGKIIMEAASKFLTPVTLELGGKCPVIIDEGCDMSVAAKRIAWGKYMSCGQTCLAPDYVLCLESVKASFVKEAQRYVASAYGSDPQNSTDYSRIINERHFDRLTRLLNCGKVTFGGSSDKSDLYIAPTILEDVKPSDAIMQEEIFGPILPIFTVKSIQEAIDFVNDREKPLALYVFSNNKHVVKQVVENTSSGGVTVNDVIFHIALDTLPFGGVGQSGMGKYHGKFSFDTFSHQKAVLKRPEFGESVLWMRYPPYDDKKFSWAKFMAKKRQFPDFWVILTTLSLVLLGLVFGYICGRSH